MNSQCCSGTLATTLAESAFIEVPGDMSTCAEFKKPSTPGIEDVGDSCENLRSACFSIPDELLAALSSL